MMVQQINALGMAQEDMIEIMQVIAGRLGMEIGTSEAEAIWTEFLRKLTRRGLRGVGRARRLAGARLHRRGRLDARPPLLPPVRGPACSSRRSRQVRGRPPVIVRRRACR
jgi:hypothetical protein